jgi:hypothetical protein
MPNDIAHAGNPGATAAELLVAAWDLAADKADIIGEP